MNKRIWTYLLSILFLIAALSWLAVLSRPTQNLRIIACDVGQGDAILITKHETQILIDGGPNGSVISCLSRHMPFWDRRIEMVVLSHPDADHASGLVDVFRAYSVSHFLENGDEKDTSVYKKLMDLVENSGAVQVLAKRNDRFQYGGVYFDVLHPQANVLGRGDSRIAHSKDSANNNSIAMKMTFGEFDALLTGDIEDAISDLVADTSVVDNLEYLKVPHHGSKNGLSEKLLNEVNPELAVISAGRNNRFGHPHQEVLEMLGRGVSRNAQIKILRTDEIGDVVIETDGKSWRQIQ